MEIGVYSFGHRARRLDGSLASTAQSITDLMEGVRLADQVGLDFFGFGEHHTASMPVSAPVTLLAAAGAATSGIRLGSTVSVLGTDDPVRVLSAGRHGMGRLRRAGRPHRRTGLLD